MGKPLPKLFPHGLIGGILVILGVAWWKGRAEKPPAKEGFARGAKPSSTPFGLREGFVYKTNPCVEHKTCGACAAAAGCGWCADKGLCGPMAQDGFPYRLRIDGRDVPVCGPHTFKTRVEQCSSL